MDCNTSRRRFFDTTLRITAAACVALAACALAPAAWALDAPTGKVVLTVSGNVQNRNAPEGASFDMPMLEKLPQHSFSTKTPWYPQARKFTGVRVRDVLAAAGARGTVINAVALNDYRVEIPGEDVARTDVIVAYLLDDKPMTVRERGPLFVIYPFDDSPDLRNAVYFSRAIWQLRTLDVK